MILEGETLVPADRRTVWKALNDADVLRACIPGCQSLEQQSDTDFTASARAAVGPVSATFGAKITLSEIEPDRGYTISGEGKGGAAGFARGKARVDLTDEGAGGTRLRYNADVNVGGKLAQAAAPDPGYREEDLRRSRAGQRAAWRRCHRRRGCAARRAGRGSLSGPPARRFLWAGIAVIVVIVIAWWLRGPRAGNAWWKGMGMASGGSVSAPGASRGDPPMVVTTR